MSFDPQTVRPETLSNLFADLLGKSVTARRTPAPPNVNWLAVAEYRKPGDAAPCVVVAFDADLSCSLGAALSMMPAAVASSSAKARQLGEPLVGNLKEVCNVATRVFQQGSDRVVLAALHVQPLKPPPAVDAILRRPRARLELAVAVSGYAAGAMGVFVP